MTLADLLSLLPLLVLSVTIVVVMLVIALYRNHLLTLLLTLLGLAAATAVVPVASARGERLVTPLLAMDRFAFFYIALLTVAAFVTSLLTYHYLERHGGRKEEFYLLLLLATLGAATLAASSHFASLFLGLELLSVPLYALIGYQRSSSLSIESGWKYLVLAATSASFLLLGIAFVYADRGTLVFSELSVLPPGGSSAALFVGGLGLIIIGLGFKLALVPFHMWAPDVYEGSPAPATAFVASVSKASVVAILLRLFTPLGVRQNTALFVGFSTVAIASMFAGNLLALVQRNVKRLLAYSSIAHLGYVLVAFLAGNAASPATSSGVAAATFYVITYITAVLAAFGIVAAISSKTVEAATLEDYHGLFWRRPWAAAVLTVALFSLASIPMTAGFLGKIYVLTAGIQAGLWALVLSLIVSTAIGLYYYIRLIVAMFRRESEDEASGESSAETKETSSDGRAAGPLPESVPWVAGLVLGVLMGALIWLGLYPAPLLAIIQEVAGIIG